LLKRLNRWLDRCSVFVDVIVAVSELDARDLARSIVHFQVGPQQLNVHELPLLRVFTFSAREVQSYVAVVRFYESIQDVQHGRDSLPQVRF